MFEMNLNRKIVFRNAGLQILADKYLLTAFHAKKQSLQRCEELQSLHLTLSIK